MRLLILSLVCLCFSPAGQAAENFYVGARLGVSQYDGTADASRNATAGPMLPSEISIDGLPFESNETTWGVNVGWRIKDWFAVELGFNDLGNTGRETFAAFGGVSAVITSGVAVDVEEVYLASKLTLSLPGKWNANWTIGITQTTFEAAGALPLITIPILAPPSPREPIPYASPDDETGFIWGFGFGWDMSDRWGLDIGYRRHDTQVFSVDSFSAGVLFSF